jgi:hypothetical protein
MSGNAAAGPGTQPRPTRSFIKSGRPYPYVTLTHGFGNSNRVPFAFARDGFRLCRSRIEIKLCDRFMKRPNRFIRLKERSLEIARVAKAFDLGPSAYDEIRSGLNKLLKEGLVLSLSK